MFIVPAIVIFSLMATQASAKISKNAVNPFNAQGKINDISINQKYIYMNDMGYRFTPQTMYISSDQQRITLKEIHEGDKAGIILDPQDGTIKVLWLLAQPEKK